MPLRYRFNSVFGGAFLRILLVSRMGDIFHRICLSGESVSLWCVNSGRIYREHNDTVESVNVIRELLLDQIRGPRVKVDNPPVWVKLANVGSLYRNTRMGAAFEGIREGRDLTGEFELFRICRQTPCRFSGDRNADYLSSEKKPRAVTHVSSVAVSGETVDVNPVTDRPGPVQGRNR